MPSGFSAPFRHSGKEKKKRSLVGVVRTTPSLLCGWKTFGFLPLPQIWLNGKGVGGREGRRLCECPRVCVSVCVWGGGHLAEVSDGGVRVPMAECGVLGSTSKPGMQGPSLSVPTCSTLGTKVGSGFTAPASEVGTLRSGSWGIGGKFAC